MAKFKINRKKNLVGVIFTILLIVLIIIISNDILNNNQFQGFWLKSSENINQTGYSSEEFIVGYCPTMKDIANHLDSENKIKLIVYESTSDAIMALKSNKVDAILVGRIIKETELKNSFNKKLGEGITLVGNQKNFILKNNLDDLNIYTYLDKQEVSKHFSQNFFNRINYNLEKVELIDSLKNNEDLVILINWDDYKDEMELIIPIYNNFSKLKEFRIPIIYSLDDEIIRKIKVN